MYHTFLESGNTELIKIIENLTEEKLLKAILNGENVWWKLKNNKVMLILVKKIF